MSSQVPSGGISEFLIELNAADSLVALYEAHSQSSALVFKIDNYPNPIKVHIENFSDKRVILSNNLNELDLPPDTEVSIKFNVGTEIFFAKTFIKKHMSRNYFDISTKVVQLKRRKEPRYLIPKKWAQTASIVLGTMKTKKELLLKCSVVDISFSGIRLEIANTQTNNLHCPAYKRDDIIKIKFQVYKRAEVEATAIIRFYINKPGMPAFIGLEFANMTNVQKERVSSIIEDISLFTTTNKNTR
ncbi:MAG: PilZ domain-containing protein [Bdellovibrionota bacterium]